MIARTLARASSFVVPLLLAASARAGGHPTGGAMIRTLGGTAPFATHDAWLEGLVALPPGVSAESLGLEPVVPGFGRVRGAPPAIVAFEQAHRGLGVELAPGLHIFMDRAGGWTRATTAHLDAASRGDGVLVGVADTGLDVSHPDFRDADGNTRVAWILDMSSAPAGIYPDLEKKFGVTDDSGKLVLGAVYAAKDLNKMLAAGVKPPTDDVGHGTHVTSIAAGNGGLGANHTPYVGIAPDAMIIFARITRDATGNIDNGDLVRGAQFLFDRADAMGKPIAVNLSLGSDFGPHDGTLDWEQVLASYVGPDKPGRALVAAAGNSGSILDTPVHDSARATSGTRMRVPIQTAGASNGRLQVWVAMRPGASLKVGLDGPDGTWIDPVGDGEENGKNTADYQAGVINGSGATNSEIPQGSHGATVVVSGRWPSGTYSVTLEGDGLADLYLGGDGDVVIGDNAGFSTPVREGTVNLPATNPMIIGVGCTVNRTSWTSIDHQVESEPAPVLDSVGGLVATNPSDPSHPLFRDAGEGEIAFFSSAGPTVNGLQKPEISAPGGLVIAAMSQQAQPGEPNSIFTVGPASNRALQVDARHGVSQGTSMASPMVAGAVALLFQRDPTLTQDKVMALLQAGAHPFRGYVPFDDQSGPGELDVVGALDALDQAETHPRELLPDAASSWMTLSEDYLPADGSTPLTVILELRNQGGTHRADLFDMTRLRPIATVDGAPLEPLPTLYRRAPGVWFFTVTPPPGRGGSGLTIGATFDGAPIVPARTIPIAADVWRSEYASTAKGSGCATSGGARPLVDRTTGALAFLVAACAFARRRARSCRSCRSCRS